MPSNEGSPQSTTESSPSSTASSGPKKEPDFSNEALCDLLTADEAVSLGGGTAGEPGNSIKDGHPQCAWSDATSLILGFQKGAGYTPPSDPEITNTDITIAGKPAILSKRVSSVRTNCQVIFQPSDDSVLSTLAGLHDKGVGQFEECALATKFANIVIPKVLEYY